MYLDSNNWQVIYLPASYVKKKTFLIKYTNKKQEQRFL